MTQSSRVATGNVIDMNGAYRQMARMASLCGGRELKWTISRILSVHHSLSVLDRGQGHGAGWGPGLSGDWR